MKNKLLILGFVIAFLTRFIGVYPGYNNYHSDEPIVYGTALDMVRNNNLDPGRYDYPGVSIYLNYIAYRTVFIPIGWISYYISNIPQIIDGTVHIPIDPLTANSIRQTYIFGNRDINVLTWGRTVAATFSFGTVILAYFFAKKLFNKDTAIISVYFLAFNFRQVLNSHVNLPDIYNAFFLLLSFIATFRLWESQTKKNYLIAGISAGLSFSTKYQFFAFLPIFLVQFFNSIENNKINLRKLFDFRILIALAVGVLIFFVTNPYFLPNIELAIFWIQGVSVKYGMGIKQINLYPLFYYYHFDLGPIEFILAVFGFVISIFRNFKKTMFVLIAITPFFYILNYYSRGGFYVRNYVTVTPIILIFAAYAFVFLFEFLRKKINKYIAGVILFVLLFITVFVPAKNTIINDLYDTKKYDYNQLSDWMFAHIPSGTVIAANPFDPPTGTPDIKKTEFELNGSFSMSEHRDDGAEYALLNTDWGGNNFYIWMNFGFNDLKLFWNKPYEIMRNTFFGIAEEELVRWQVYSATKPWQAPDANLILAKIPVWPLVSMHILQNFNFSNVNGWRVLGNYSKIANFNFYDDKTGYKDKGSLVLPPTNDRFETIRVASTPIKVLPGHLYTVSGYLKTNKLLTEDKRDGFIRIDFYKDNKNTDGLGIITTVSSRIYGTTDWSLKDITERAPETSNYMVVSLQDVDTAGPSIWLDDLIIKESDNVIPDMSLNTPYVKKQIDLNLLYPNSHGNL